MSIIKRIYSIVIGILITIPALSANTIITVDQVSEAVTINESVDYIINSSTPFTTVGSVDVVNTEHAVVIIANIRPSIVIKNWLKYVKINGATAVDGSNCQVKMYAHGTIIMPYSKDIRPLTVFSEQNFGGTSVNAFGLENSGGYMNTLTDAKLNNQIRSFKLKRGYMVTFSTRAEGRGYSRCFIADKEDLEFATLPKILDQKISSYRVFQWYDAQKKGLASDTRVLQNNMLVSSWCYDWGTGVNRLPDTECVPNHIYEDWPSSAACGSVTYACHMKNNNEPGNSADDTPQDVATVLANWENLMRTGLRLCSETSHDGSWAHLDAFIDSIDARGWRCDIVDLHCYWPRDNFFNWQYWYNRFGNRPIWISEWVVGASWNNNGIFATDRTTSAANLQLNADYLKYVIPSMNESPYIERYSYWNSEADVSKLIIGEKMTPAGEYYASVKSGLAYKRSQEKIPTTPKMKAPTGLVANYDKETQKVTLEWHEYNGEYNQAMIVQRKRAGTNVWVTAENVTQKENSADYSVSVDGIDGDNFRISITDMAGYTLTSNTATAVNEDIQYGDAVTVVNGDNVSQKFLGGNMLVNGDFELGLTDWQNGTGAPLAAPYFQAVPMGSIDGSAFLQCYGNSTDKTGKQSVYKTLTLENNSSYYISIATCNANNSTQRFLTGRTVGINKRAELPESSSWMNTASSFTIGEDTILYIQFTSTNARFMADNISVCKLFDSKDAALADAKVQALRKVGAFITYNTAMPRINTLLEEAVSSPETTVFDIEDALRMALGCLAQKDVCDSLAVPLSTAQRYGLVDDTKIKALYDAVASVSQNSLNDYLADLHALKDVFKTVFKSSPLPGAIKNSSFTSTTGWKLKSGTYTGGDQRTATQAGKTCWNAWWSLSATSNPKATMAIEQEITGLEQGLYSLSCLASTQHLCETDQHAFIRVNDEEVVSQPLRYGLLDLPYFSNSQMWNNLSTPYVYVRSGDVVTIGFRGSKTGASDKQWMKYGDANNTGDNREGWWCATDFTLNYMPLQQIAVDNSGWGTICLAHRSEAPFGVTIYQIAGISADSLYIGIEEVTGSTEAGCPYIIKANPNSTLLFTLSGASVSTPMTNVNGLRGILKSSAKYPLGSMVLVDGKWTVVTERYAMTQYSAMIQKATNLPLLPAGWTGIMLPTSGLVSTDINGIMMDGKSKSKTFNLGGARVPDNAKGLLIINNRKVIKK